MDFWEEIERINDRAKKMKKAQTSRIDIKKASEVNYIIEHDPHKEEKK